MSPANEVTANPCVRNCCLDEEKICMGCGRRLAEILEWHRADEQRKRNIIDLSQRRLQQLQKVTGG